MQDTEQFTQAFRGGFTGILRWHQLDELWETLKSKHSDDWYVYAVGEEPPTEPTSAEQLNTFINEIDQLLHAEHEEDYCGIVYVDDKENPSFVKIFDPNNLGVSCGFSDNPPLPGWTLSKLKPVDLEAAFPPPGNRRRWWQKIFG